MKTKPTGNELAVRFSLAINVIIVMWLALSAFKSSNMISTDLLGITDQNGIPKMMLSGGTGGAMLVMVAEGQPAPLVFHVSKLGYPSIILNGQSGLPAVEISTVSEGGGAQISLYDAQGYRVWQVMVDDSGQSRIIETPRTPIDSDEPIGAAGDDDSGDTGG